MMKLSTMLELINTLDDRGKSPLFEQILVPWAHEPGTAKFLRASANFICVFQSADQNYVLRFNHDRERSASFIAAEVDYLHFLAGAGIRVARPILSLAGNDVESVPTSLGVYHAVVFEALAGEQLESADLTPDQFMQWGKALGELHLAAQGYQTSGRRTWRDHLEQIATSLPAHEQAARHVLDQVMRQLSALPVRADNFGLIHFDFELDNLIWTPDGLGIIDFDDSAGYWFAADIAFALRDLFNDSAAQVDLKHTALLTFIEGYRMAKPITQTDIALIPLFLAAHNLVMFAKLLRTLENGEQPEDPAWLTGLRYKLEAKVQTYRNGFAEIEIAGIGD